MGNRLENGVCVCVGGGGGVTFTGKDVMNNYLST